MQDEICEGESRRRRRSSFVLSAERDGEVHLRDVELVRHRKLELDGRQQQVRFDQSPERDRTFARFLSRKKIVRGWPRLGSLSDLNNLESTNNFSPLTTVYLSLLFTAAATGKTLHNFLSWVL